MDKGTRDRSAANHVPKKKVQRKTPERYRHRVWGLYHKGTDSFFVTFFVTRKKASGFLRGRDGVPFWRGVSVRKATIMVEEGWDE